MDYRLIVAIIRRSTLESVESRLVRMHVPGISVSAVKGFGEYTDFFARGWMVEHVRIEVFARKDQAETIARAIADCARSGTPGDGLVAVLPVEGLTRIRTLEPAALEDLSTK